MLPSTRSFTTTASATLGPAPVLLGTAGDFVVGESESLQSSVITGNIGASPLTLPPSPVFHSSWMQRTFATATQVVGKVYAAVTRCQLLRI